jgi:membrane protein DedA with SNARE-associated domain
MNTLLTNLVAWIESSKYVLIFLGTIIEGPIVMLSSGFLYRLGSFAFIPMYAALVLGDFVADLLWYCLGRFGGRKTVFKYSRFIKISPEKLDKVETLFKKHQIKILIISKLTMGLGFAQLILIVAGLFKVDFRKYAVLNLIGGFIWTAIVISLGYFLGNAFYTVSKPMRVGFVIVMIVLFVVGLRYLNKYLENRNV